MIERIDSALNKEKTPVNPEADLKILKRETILSKLKKLGIAKQKGRSEASRQNISNFDFWHEASLRAFCFATLIHFKRN